MNYEPYILTEESVREEIKNTPAPALITFYCIAKYHEKYKLTGWMYDELKRRHLIDKSINDFDQRFVPFYEALLNQEDL